MFSGLGYSLALLFSSVVSPYYYRYTVIYSVTCW